MAGQSARVGEAPIAGHGPRPVALLLKDRLFIDVIAFPVITAAPDGLGIIAKLMVFRLF